MLISIDEIHKSLSSKGWKYSDKKINKIYTFDKYLKGINFVNHIAKLAEVQNHHPEIIIKYCSIKISISSHELDGVSTKCINLAIKIDEIIKNFNG